MQATLPGMTRPEASRIGLGCRAFAGPGGLVDPRAAAALIWFAIEAGVALIDDVGSVLDGVGRSQVHRTIAARREEILLTAHVRPEPGRAPDGSLACDAELRRMAVDHIDICFLHATGSGIPIEDHVGDLAQLVAAGKIRRLGIADGTSQDLRRAHATHPIVAFSSRYSLLERRTEADSLPVARELGLMVVAAAPLGRGVLANHTPDQRSAEAWRHPVLAEALSGLQELATELNIGRARLALAWLLSRGPDIAPVPSTRDRVHLEMNVMAQRVQLPPEVADRLAAVFPVGGFGPPPSE
jgi:aryl-alcohol dehydrogenase-like predicted oxidoreductase